jgi:hypothetical protein
MKKFTLLITLLLFVVCSFAQKITRGPDVGEIYFLGPTTTILQGAIYHSTDFGGKQRKIKSVGAKWSDFQARNYGVNSQPYYVLLDNDENRLAEPYGFNTNIDEFLAFLDKGIEGYKAGK